MCVVTQQEKETWPEEKYKKSDRTNDTGIMNSMHDGLDKFGPNFERLITFDKLKRMTSVGEYLGSIVSVSKGLCSKAMQLRRDDAQNQDAVSLKEIREELDRKVLPKAPDAAPVDKNKYGSRNYPTMPGYGVNNRTPPGRLASLEEQIDEDDSFMSEIVSARVQPILTPSKDFDYDDEEDLETDLMALMGRGSTAMGSGGKTLYNDKAKAPVDPNKPCFIHFNTGCDNRCGGFSHDEKVMEKLAFTSLENLVNSRYGGEARTLRNLKIILSNATTTTVGHSTDKYQPSRARFALVTGDNTVHPGLLVPAAGGGPGESSPPSESS